MKERGILFSAPMVRALLAGTKTQTRRALRQQPHGPAGRVVQPFDDGRQWFAERNPNEAGELLLLDAVPHCPYGQPGDRLWVRETWRVSAPNNHRAPRDIVPCDSVHYEADSEKTWPAYSGKGRPGMFMPRWASRITLEITGVRVERLQHISEADAVAEGCTSSTAANGVGITARDAYSDLWESINGPGSWGANPWVWVVEFRRI